MFVLHYSYVRLWVRKYHARIKDEAFRSLPRRRTISSARNTHSMWALRPHRVAVELRRKRKNDVKIDKAD